LTGQNGLSIINTGNDREDAAPSRPLSVIVR
jgi:hypothetical protein